MNAIIDTFKSFGVTEWSMFVTNFILIAVIFFYNSGVMKCKEKLASYELEIKDKDKLINYYEQITGKGVASDEGTNQD